MMELHKILSFKVFLIWKLYLLPEIKPHVICQQPNIRGESCLVFQVLLRLPLETVQFIWESLDTNHIVILKVYDNNQ